MKKYGFTAIMLAAIAAVGLFMTNTYVKSSNKTNPSVDEDQISIVTSFYPMYIASKNIIGDLDGQEIVLSNLSEPQTGCLHDYQLTPEDMIELSTADIFIYNGGGAENFILEVTESYPDLICIDASQLIESEEETEVEETEHDHEAEAEEAEHEHDHETEAEEAEHEHDHEAEAEEAEHEHDHDTEEEETEAEHGHSHDHGEENSHYWMSTQDYALQIQAIVQQLAAVDPQHKSLYEENGEAYLNQVSELTEQMNSLKELYQGRRVVLFHEAFEYLAEDLGMDVAQIMDMDEERQISAGEVADVVHAIQEGGVEVLFVEELYGADMADTVARETGVEVIFLDTLVRGEYNSDSYLEGMQGNIDLLQEYIK